jgi:hypothetical protein
MTQSRTSRCGSRRPPGDGVIRRPTVFDITRPTREDCDVVALRAWIRRTFVEPSAKPPLSALPNSVWLLVIPLCLLCFDLGGASAHRWPHSHPAEWANLGILVMLILNQLAHGFRWGPVATPVLRAAAWIWIVLGSGLVWSTPKVTSCALGTRRNGWLNGR